MASNAIMDTNPNDGAAQDVAPHGQISLNANFDLVVSEKREAFFDFQKPGWKLVILNFAIGIPASLLFAIAVKLGIRLVITVMHQCGINDFISSCIIANDTIANTATALANNTIANLDVRIQKNEEAWEQWERLLCSVIFSVTNCVLILVWAMQIEEAGIERQTKEQRIARLKEERRFWEMETERLEGLLKAIETGEFLNSKINDSSSHSSFVTIYNLPNMHRYDAMILDALKDEKYYQLLEEQRRRSGGVAPESLPVTPVLGSEDQGGFAAAASVGLK